MLNYLFLVDEDDEDFFSLYIPYMFQADDENIMDVYKAMNNVNNSIKVVKLLINEDDVWAACECRWPKDADISEILSFAIVTLFRAYGDFHKELKNL
jgi:hypothetical protein